LKSFLLIILISLTSWKFAAQNLKFKIIGKTPSETIVIDSLQYRQTHNNLKTINEEVNKVASTLFQKGYIDNSASATGKLNDSTYISTFSLGEKIDLLYITVPENISIDKTFPSKNNVVLLSYSKLDSFLNQTIQSLEARGFALANVKLENIERVEHTLYADLKVELTQQRLLNGITIRYSDDGRKNQFPEGHLKQINRKYQKRLFNQKTVTEIHEDFGKFSFVNQIKFPEILFTKDSTTVYVYLEKTNANNFDGFLGFANNENNKIGLIGYLDVTLNNILSYGEQLSLYWKSDGNDQKTFTASFELPYLFRTPIGLKAYINIFRQDSTFQNTKTAIDLSYYINHSSRFYLGYQATESSDIQNSVGTSISDFNNSFVTSSFEYIRPDRSDSNFPVETKFHITTGLGSRAISEVPENSSDKQFTINLQAIYNFYLNKKNSIYVNSQNFYLQSERYLTNELFRFGGLNSIRGFAENSLEAYFSSTVQTEYRYVIAPTLYAHTILDYSIFKNKSFLDAADVTENLFGFGMGLGLQTANGLFKLSVANGRAKNQEFQFSNTIITLKFNVKF
jgi:hypothetical protein